MAKISNFSKSNLSLHELILTYEQQSEEVPTVEEAKNENDLKTISVDINRNFPFYENMTDDQKRLFKKDLKGVLLKLPLNYIQSMCDIVAILMYFYYSKSKKDASLVSLTERENTASAINLGASKNSLYDEETYDVMYRVIYNILKQKYVPLIDDQFKKYLENNEVFIKMMKKRNIVIPSSKSLIYTNSTLTWFSRSIENIDDIYKIFSLIISCPTSVVFLLLVHYYDYIENKKKIQLGTEDIMPKLINLEKEFLKIQEESEDKPKVSKKVVALSVAAGAIATGAIFFGIFKKFK